MSGDSGGTGPSGVPEAERSHPLFRRGYNLGYSNRAHEESLLDLEQRGPRSLRGEPVASVPTTFDVAAGGLLHRLAPGVRIARDLTSRTETEISTETPCCGRRIMLAKPNADQPQPAMCCRCHITYQVTLVQEEPDGYNDSEPQHVALFVVAQVAVAAAQHRAGKWEPGKRSGPPDDVQKT